MDFKPLLTNKFEDRYYFYKFIVLSLGDACDSSAGSSAKRVFF